MIQSQTKTQSDVIKAGDTIYLEHMTGKYLTTAHEGRYKWPTLHKTGQVKLEIQSNIQGELKDGSVVQLKSTESKLDNHNILGAFMDSHDCYYWKDGYSAKKQGWYITKRNRNGDDKIRYGDEVYFTNLHYTNQRLARCSWYD